MSEQLAETPIMSSVINMIPYNTGMEQLQLPELGRNLQNLVNYCVEIEDRDQRTQCANAIIKIMEKLHPKMVGAQGDTHKLWDQLQIMSRFKLDVDSPYERITEEMIHEKPKPIPYSQGAVKNRIYGVNVMQMVMKALEMDDGEAKDKLIFDLANKMKAFMYASNKQSATDERVLNDLKEITGGLISLDSESYPLLPLGTNIQKPKWKNNKKRKGKK